MAGGRRAELSLVRGRVRSGPGPAVTRGPQVLTEWINAKLLPEHIVVRSLEEDIFDGLILHHLFRKWLLPKLGSPGGLGGPDSPGACPVPSAVPFADWLQDSPTSYGFLSPCHGAGAVNPQNNSVL